VLLLRRVSILAVTKATVQVKIRSYLRVARTSEPYPVWMTWESLSRKVYGYCNSNTVQNLRRAAEKMHDVEMLRFGGGRKHAGPRLYGTPEETWLRGWVCSVHDGTMEGVDYGSYKPPGAEKVWEAFWKGCHQERPLRVDLSGVVKMVNKCCGTTLDPSEVAWWRAGLEAQRSRERQELIDGLHGAFAELAVKKERQECEARQIDFGRIRIDPLTVARCPCCLRNVEPGYFPVQRNNSTALTSVDV
jgi:hypothetical protein